MPLSKLREFTIYYGILFGILNLTALLFFYNISIIIWVFDAWDLALMVSFSIFLGSYLCVFVVSKFFLEKKEVLSNSILLSYAFVIGLISVFFIGIPVCLSIGLYLTDYNLSFVLNNVRADNGLSLLIFSMVLFIGWFWLVGSSIISAFYFREVLKIPSERPSIDPRDFE